MIDVASRATGGVSIPGQKGTRAEIIRTFKKHLNGLKTNLTACVFQQIQPHMEMTAVDSNLQSTHVPGAINLTCDTWQASNTDGYFAVTAHWIEESSPSHWDLRNALLGFVRLNNAHNGKRLGQALFKVVKHAGIEGKVCTLYTISHLTFWIVQIGHVMCDNAKNNRTMLQEFANQVKKATGRNYPWQKCHIK